MALRSLLQGRRTVVLTGAGCSTRSGIPDYRGPETRRRARNPVQHRAFVRDAAARRRYWARSMTGWPRFSRFAPNATHLALAAAEARGEVTGVITQNVDRLHHRAGSRQVVELHGRLSEVRCLACETVEARDVLQRRLEQLNPTFVGRRAELAPDGDADLERVDGFVVPPCRACGGVLKPNVVFFGENVPAPTVAAAWRLFEASEVLLVVGSSLAVFSGYRFVRRAAKEGVPVAIVNLGPTRGDAHADVVVDGEAGEVLEALWGAAPAVDRSFPRNRGPLPKRADQRP
ncbi:MAG: NAD-dependent protein deacetylase [Myxococcota bacterium]